MSIRIDGSSNNTGIYYSNHIYVNRVNDKDKYFDIIDSEIYSYEKVYRINNIHILYKTDSSNYINYNIYINKLMQKLVINNVQDLMAEVQNTDTPTTVTNTDPNADYHHILIFSPEQDYMQLNVGTSQARNNEKLHLRCGYGTNCKVSQGNSATGTPDRLRKGVSYLTYLVNYTSEEAQRLGFNFELFNIHPRGVQ